METQLREQEKIFYRQVEEQLGGLDINADETLAALEALNMTETALPAGMSTVLRELRPELTDEQRALTEQRGLLNDLSARLKEAQEKALDNREANPLAEEVIAGRESILDPLPRENALSPIPGRTSGARPVPGLDETEVRELTFLMEDLSPDSLLSALDEADARRQAIVLLSKIPSRQRTEKQKSVLARLKEDAKVARLEEDRNQLSDLVATLTNTVERQGTQASPVSVYRLLSIRTDIREAMRKLRPDPNNADTVRQLGKLNDATLQDLEKFSGDFGSPSVVITVDGEFNFLDDQIEDGMALATDDRFEVLRRANAFTRSLHNVFTRTFGGTVRARDSRGAFKIEPAMLYESLMQGSGNKVALKMSQLAEAVNWLYSPEMRQFADGPELNFDQLNDLNVNRLGTLLGAETDIVRFFASQTTDPDTQMIDPGRAKTFLRQYEGTLGRIFPQVFQDLNDAKKAALLVKNVEKEAVDQKRLFEQEAFSQFIGLEDSGGSIVRNIIGIPGDRPTNSIKNFVDLLKQLDNAPLEAKEGLKDIILEDAFTFAGGAQTEIPFSFRRLRDYLFRPMGVGKNSPSVADLLKEEGLLSAEHFNQYRVMLDQAERVAKVAEDVGPAFQGDLVDSGFVLQSLAIRMIGSGLATGTMEKARQFFPGLLGTGTGNIAVPAAGASAAMELFEAQPNALVRDIFIEAFKNPRLLKEVLEAAPTEKRQYEKLRQFPAFLADAGIRLVESVAQDEPLEDVGIAPVDRTLPGERRRQARPRPRPAPQPTTTPPPQPAPVVPPPQASIAPRTNPQSLQRAAQILGPQDEIGMLASEMLMRQRSV